MKNKSKFLGLSLFVFGLCLLFMISCEKIPVLSTTEVSDITSSTAMSGGNITDDHDLSVTAHGVCWSTSQTPTIADNKTADGTGTGNFTSAMTGLTANTIYFVRAYATNSAGTGYGNIISFTTKEGVIYGSFTDSRDGYVYKTVKIGNQVWMAENLRYLPSVVGPEIESETTPYYYVYDYNGTNVSEAKTTDNFSTYGVLYNWTAACSSCPSGWHLPSDAERAELGEYLGGNEVAGAKLKETGTTHWQSPNQGATNASGFTALPGGIRLDYGSFYFIGNDGAWWSSTELDANYAFSRLLNYDNYHLVNNYDYKVDGFSIRCVKD